MSNKVLTYIPIAPKTPKIYGRSLQSIFNIDWPYKTEIVFGRNDNPIGHKYDDLALKHNEARRLAIIGNYDSLLFVENDMVVPTNALIELDKVDADVVYGLYCNRHGYHRWLAFSFIEDLHGVSISQDPDLMKKVWGKPFQTQGAGLGCTLIRKNVLTKVKFKTHPDHKVADDWIFAQDCKAKGFSQAHHFGVHCGHIKTDLTTLWPAINKEGYTLEFLNDGSMTPTIVEKDKPLNINIGMETRVIHGYKL